MATGSRTPGFTFSEAVVTMGLMVVFATLVGVVFFQGGALSGQLDRHYRQLQDKVSFASYLPRLCQRIAPPAWANPEQVFSVTASGLSIQYWDSDREQSLRFEVTDGHLTARTPQGSWSWPTLEPMTVEYWKSSDRIVGLQIGWTENGRRLLTYIPWGSRPL